MWRRSLSSAAVAAARRRSPDARVLSSSTSSASSAAAVDSLILRSLKEHYLEVSKMSPPPKVNPPSPYTIVKGALDRDGPALRREYKGEEITISVMRLANILPSGAEADDDDDNEAINQLFLHVDVSKPGREESLHFLCGLYPDAVGIHSVCLRPKTGSLSLASLNKYEGRVFQELDQKLRDAFHLFIEARGVNESLFRFLQAWLYVKDHRNLMGWFKSVGTFINEQKKS
ncbi:hypothetical protein IEQ34_018461 [Dendrobium chrysotoxum]|uniref:Uncharacterized protein n=1 Tax=Dendrobium chrysotoxum TaxID=161865 RepID=A0AAV7G5X6_DENCH|nr:hypothetical protein IEQ34_018461 [Dendrobium chrysotoxum]